MKGESLIEAAKRELLEETGYTPLTIEMLDHSYTFPVVEPSLYAEGVNEIMEYVFLAEVDGKDSPSIDPREHDDWRWCTFEEAEALAFWPQSVESLKRCQSVLTCKRET